MMTINGYTFNEFAEPSDLPVAVLNNGCLIWDEEKADSLSWDVIAGRPRAIAQANAELRAKADREEMARREETAKPSVPTVVREFRERGRAARISYVAHVKEMSDGSLTGHVEDKSGNYLFPFTYAAGMSLIDAIADDMYGWVAEN